MEALCNFDGLCLILQLHQTQLIKKDNGQLSGKLINTDNQQSSGKLINTDNRQSFRELINADNQQSSGKLINTDNHQSSGKDNCKFAEEQQQDKCNYGEDDIVPVVVRPGHIRFEPFEKGWIENYVTFFSN